MEIITEDDSIKTLRILTTTISFLLRKLSIFNDEEKYHDFLFSDYVDNVEAYDTAFSVIETITNFTIYKHFVEYTNILYVRISWENGVNNSNITNWKDKGLI